MDKLERIKTEQDRLIAIFSELDENELQVAEGLIKQAAFMLITLEDLQIAIQQNGSVGEYKNGKDQYGTKQSAELQAYNQTLRSYNAVIGKLLKIVPHKPVYVETVQERWERIQKEKEIERIADKDELDKNNEEFIKQLKELRESYNE